MCPQSYASKLNTTLCPQKIVDTVKIEFELVYCHNAVGVVT